MIKHQNLYCLLLFFALFMITACEFIDENDTQLNEQVVLLKNELGIKEAIQGRELRSNLKTIDNITIRAYQEEGKKIDELFGENEHIFVIHFTKACCRASFDLYLRIINQLAKVVDHSKILVLANDPDPKYMKLEQLKYKLPVTCSTINEPIDLPINNQERNDIPFMFILNKERQVLFPKVGLSRDSINSPYFERIIDFLQ